MSGWSDTIDCHECGSTETLEIWSELHEVGGICLVCGYMYETIEKQLSLEEVNEERADLGMELLIELRPKLRT